MDRRAFLALAGRATAAAVAAAAWRPLAAEAAVPALVVREDLAFWDRAGRAYRLEPLAHHVARLDAAGAELWRWGGDPRTGPNTPVALGEDRLGRLMVLAQGGSEVHVLDLHGKHLASWTTPAMREATVTDMVVAGGRVYLAQPNLHRVLVTSEAGRPLGVLGGPGQLHGPRSVAVDGAGCVHVLDAGDRRVRVYAPDGRLSRTYAADGRLVAPRAIAAAAGRIYVADGVGVVHEFSGLGEPVAAHAVTLPGVGAAMPHALSRGARGEVVVVARSGRLHVARG